MLPILMAVALVQIPSSGTPLELGRTFQIPSRVLGETRTIDVTLPRGYAAGTAERYPVLFVLDGEFEHQIGATVATFYATMSQLPPMIVVGVRNTDRSRDMTPAPVAGFRVPEEAENAGGADKFVTFFSDELIPYIDRTYRTAPLRVLAGHSLGGLFAMYTLVKQPDLFSGYLVMEPSTWWNDEKELRDVRRVLTQPAARRARVMLVNAQHLGLDTAQWGGNKPMIRELSITGETHQSMALAGMMLGLKTMFADFKPSDWRPGSKPIAMLDRYDSLITRIGYAPPIQPETFERVIRMSIHGRFFDDAAIVLERMERALGPSQESRELRDMLVSERAMPIPAGFIPLEIPERRPSSREARAFLGRWEAIGQSDIHKVEIRASGDTLIVHDSIQFPSGDWFEGDDPVIQVTPDGTLEWGLPFFRGIAALVVLQARMQPDGTMIVSRQVRGWVPRGEGPELNRTERFRKAS